MCNISDIKRYHTDIYLAAGGYSIIVPSSYMKLIISKQPIADYVQIMDKTKTVDIKFTSRHKSQIFFNPNKSNVAAKSILDILMESYKFMPQIINENILQSILSYFKAVLRTNEDILNNSEIKQFFKAFYYIDLDPIIEENKENVQNTEILKDLVNYSTLLNVHYDTKLKAKVEHHASFRNIYNTVSSYKYMIKGVLNDAELYSHFKYFYTEKYNASSGRSNTKQYFLQFQGTKFVYALMTFMRSKPIFTKEEYIKYIKIITTKVPTLIINPALTAEDSGYMNYKNSIKQKFHAQLISLFKFNNNTTDNFDSYPSGSTATIAKKVDWISSNIKKYKHIWLAYTLLEKYLADDYGNCLYQQDATSSALQMIGILMNDHQLCIKSNIIGKTYIDIYSSYNIKLTEGISLLKTFITETVQPIMVQSLGGTKQEKHVYNLITNNDTWYRTLKKPDYTFETAITNRKLKEQILMIKIPLIFTSFIDTKDIETNVEEEIEGYNDVDDDEIDNDTSDLIPVMENSTTTIKTKNDPLRSIIGTIRKLHQAFLTIDTIDPNILAGRAIPKALLMLRGYNTGERAISKNIYKYLYEALCLKGAQTINTPHLKKISLLVFALLIPEVTQDMQSLSTYASIMRNHILGLFKTNQIPVILESPYIKWTFIKHHIKTVNCNHLTDKRAPQKSALLAYRTNNTLK